MSALGDGVVSVALGCLLAVFALSLASKVAPRGRRAFLASVRLPSGWRSWETRAGRVVLGAEALLVVLLLLGPVWSAVRAPGLALAAALLLAFAAWLRWRVATGSREPCRCFGTSAVPPAAWQVWRNLALAALAIAGVVAALAGAEAAAAGVLVGLLAGLLVGHSEDVIFLFGRPLVSEEVRALIPDPRPWEGR